MVHCSFRFHCASYVSLYLCQPYPVHSCAHLCTGTPSKLHVLRALQKRNKALVSAFKLANLGKEGWSSDFCIGCEQVQKSDGRAMGAIGESFR